MSATATLIDAARRYRHAGLCVLPAHRAQKRPALPAWKAYRERLPTEPEINTWFAGAADGLCLVCGAVSGHLEMIDFDGGGELFPAWCERVKLAAPGLLDKPVIEQSPSGGCHVAYRCEVAISGNLKLA